VTGRESDPAVLAQIRHDLRVWWGEIGQRNRQIAEALGLGYRACEVAEMFDLSRARVTQIRNELAETWYAL
jgi:hypothetical protein